ncbi:MAG: glycerophosphodiester phosphodiesterase family protein, partial [Candidatus Kapabacteria bacterium]|nr:glycerophosphodiester phosphodiesterase family protein [Candidatus Kapabacteria bacterium]
MRFLVAIVLSLLTLSCVSELQPVVYPTIDYAAELANATPLDGTRRLIVSGVYLVEDGKGRLGDTVAVRFDGTRFTIYAARNVTFVGGAGGAQGDSAIFIGTWRAVTGPEAGRLDLTAPAKEGGRELVEGKGSGKGLVLQGKLHLASSSEYIKLKKLGQIKGRLRGFQIIAHRGGGRNSERLGRSENSIPMMLFASVLGATGIEIDIHMTKERIPVIFHDPTFTARTVPSPYVIGNVESYTLAQMRVAARLVNGETIPTLREALRAVIDS